MISILLVDDHTIFRKGLTLLLSETPHMKVADEVGTGSEAMKKITANDYDIAIIDIMLPDISGVELLSQIKKVKPRLALMVLTMYPERYYALACFKAGASGYLTKESASEELINALEKVSRGERYVSSTMVEQLLSSAREEKEKSPCEILSRRERQILQMIIKGNTQKQIAEELFLSPKTVNTYRSRILEKLGVKTNIELIHYAIKEQLVDIS